MKEHPFRRKGPDQSPPESQKPLDETDAVASWRYLRLVEARAKVWDQPFSFEHLDALGKVATSDADLHKACAALIEGCDPQTLADIYS